LDKTWSTKALGKNGKSYKTMLLTSPFLPIAIFLFNWYMFSVDDMPILIVVVVLGVSLAFIYQCYEMYRFLRVASKTAKIISVGDNGKIALSLFSNKTLEIAKGEYTFLRDTKRNIIPSSKKLFPKNKMHGILAINDKYFYLSGTTDDAEEMYNYLSQQSS
jgi:hypothetical protein